MEASNPLYCKEKTPLIRQLTSAGTKSFAGQGLDVGVAVEELPKGALKFMGRKE
jgi:hypothetical protein